MRHHRPRPAPQEEPIGGGAQRREPGMLGDTLKDIAMLAAGCYSPVVSIGTLSPSASQALCVFITRKLLVTLEIIAVHE